MAGQCFKPALPPRRDWLLSAAGAVARTRLRIVYGPERLEKRLGGTRKMRAAITTVVETSQGQRAMGIRSPGACKATGCSTGGRMRPSKSHCSRQRSGRLPPAYADCIACRIFRSCAAPLRRSAVHRAASCGYERWRLPTSARSPA